MSAKIMIEKKPWRAFAVFAVKKVPLGIAES